MKKNNIITIAAVILFLISSTTSCRSTSIIGSSYKKPTTYNLKFIGFDNNTIRPDKAKRSFYKILINQAIKGRTTTGLEFQKKTYTVKLSTNKHVLVVKKHVLDKRTKQYRMLNNINQPKPGYVSFSIPEDRIVVITLKVGKNNKAKYLISYEKD